MAVTKFVVLLAFLSIASAQVAQNSSDNINDYIIQNQRQYDAVLRSYDAELAANRLNYEQRVTTIYVHRDMIIEKIMEALAKINPIEVLNDKSKNCVRQYRDGIPLPESVESALNYCSSSAISYMNNYLNSPMSTRNTLSNYYNKNFKNFLTDCERKFANSTFNYTICVTETINTVNTYTINNKKTFDSQLQSSRCNGDSRIKQALQCSFNELYAAINSIAKSISKIEQCLMSVPVECAPCSSTVSPSEICSYVIELALRPIDYINATIVNPFYGLDPNNPCVLFQFNRTLGIDMM